MTFAERGALLKAMADVLSAHRDELLDLAMTSGGNTIGNTAKRYHKSSRKFLSLTIVAKSRWVAATIRTFT